MKQQKCCISHQLFAKMLTIFIFSSIILTTEPYTFNPPWYQYSSIHLILNINQRILLSLLCGTCIISFSILQSPPSTHRILYHQTDRLFYRICFIHNFINHLLLCNYIQNQIIYLLCINNHAFNALCWKFSLVYWLWMIIDFCL